MAYIVNSLEVTKAQADALIASNGLQAGTQYKITGVHPTLFNDGTNSGTTIFLVATSSNSFDSGGTGAFYNPVYNQTLYNYGIWTANSTWLTTPGTGTFNSGEAFTANNGATGNLISSLSANQFVLISGSGSGITSITGNVTGATATIASVITRTYASGSKVKWGNYVWTNVNGNIGASVNNLTLNSEWSKVAYNTTDYVLVQDSIEYDYLNDTIFKRLDHSSNLVVSTADNNNYFTATLGYNGTPIAVFQWGNPYSSANFAGCSSNSIINSYAECVNFGGYFYNNTLNTLSVITGNIVFAGSISNNNLTKGSTINGNALAGGNISFNNCYKSQINGNAIPYSSAITTNTLNLNCRINGNTLFGINSNIVSNVLEISSSIENNSFGLGATIQENIIRNTSTIVSNTCINPQNNGGLRTYIYRNYMDISCVISLNTLSTANAGSAGIYYCTLQSAIPFNGTTDGCWITGCNLAFFSRIQSCQLRYKSKIQNLTATATTRTFTNIRLVKFTYNLASVEQTLDKADILIDGSIPIYADNTAATTALLPVGASYKTSTGEQRVVV